jgi:hypothetical protein
VSQYSTKEKIAALVGIVGLDDALEIISQANQVNKEAIASGIEFKERKGKKPTPVEAEELDETDDDEEDETELTPAQRKLPAALKKAIMAKKEAGDGSEEVDDDEDGGEEVTAESLAATYKHALAEVETEEGGEIDEDAAVSELLDTPLGQLTVSEYLDLTTAALETRMDQQSTKEAGAMAIALKQLQDNHNARLEALEQAMLQTLKEIGDRVAGLEAHQSELLDYQPRKKGDPVKVAAKEGGYRASQNSDAVIPTSVADIFAQRHGIETTKEGQGQVAAPDSPSGHFAALVMGNNEG